MMRVTLFCLSVCFLFGGCSTDRRLRTDHDEVVKTARLVAASEAGVLPDQVVVNEFVEAGVGRKTSLRTKYMKYSDLEVHVVSNPKSGDARPELRAKVTTDKILYTRHTDWEKRIVEQVKRLTPKTQVAAPVTAVESGECVGSDETVGTVGMSENTSQPSSVEKAAESAPPAAEKSAPAAAPKTSVAPAQTGPAAALREQADASFKTGIKAWDEAQRTTVAATQRKVALASAEKNLEEAVRLYAESRKLSQDAALEERISSANLVLYAVRKTKILD